MMTAAEHNSDCLSVCSQIETRIQRNRGEFSSIRDYIAAVATVYNTRGQLFSPICRDVKDLFVCQSFVKSSYIYEKGGTLHVCGDTHPYMGHQLGTPFSHIESVRRALLVPAHHHWGNPTAPLDMPKVRAWLARFNLSHHAVNQFIADGTIDRKEVISQVLARARETPPLLKASNMLSFPVAYSLMYERPMILDFGGQFGQLANALASSLIDANVYWYEPEMPYAFSTGTQSTYLQSLALYEEQFDIVLLRQVAHHVSTDTLQKAARVVKKGGLLLIEDQAIHDDFTNKQHQFYDEVFGSFKEHVYCLRTLAEFVDALQPCGLSITPYTISPADSVLQGKSFQRNNYMVFMRDSFSQVLKNMRSLCASHMAFVTMVRGTLSITEAKQLYGLDGVTLGSLLRNTPVQFSAVFGEEGELKFKETSANLTAYGLSWYRARMTYIKMKPPPAKGVDYYDVVTVARTRKSFQFSDLLAENYNFSEVRAIVYRWEAMGLVTSERGVWTWTKRGSVFARQSTADLPVY